MTDKAKTKDGSDPPEEAGFRRVRGGVYQVEDVGNLDLESDLESLLSDLDDLEIEAGGKRPGDAPTVVLSDGEVADSEAAGAREPKARSLPLDADAALDTELELDDDQFLSEIGFGDGAGAGSQPPDKDALLEDIRPYQTRIEELEAEVEEITDRMKRAAADFDNYRKRQQREKQDTIQFGNEQILRDLLPVLDNLKLAIDHTDASAPSNFVDGVKMVNTLMLKTLNRHGLEPFDSVGQPFDPHFHQAMRQVPSDDVESGAVVDEAQRGFQLNGRLLRPALVTVSKGPATPKQKQAEPDAVEPEPAAAEPETGPKAEAEAEAESAGAVDAADSTESTDPPPEELEANAGADEEAPDDDLDGVIELGAEDVIELDEDDAIEADSGSA